MASVRPATQRTSSTNIGGGQRQRELEGKIAIVTGASRGIGLAIAESLAGKGANLILGYTSEKSAAGTEELAKRLQNEHSVAALIVQADMAEAGGPAHLVTTVKNHFSHPKTGKLQIDIIINNAGVSVNNVIEKCTAEDFDWQYRVNVLAPLLLVQAALPYLPNDRSGRIVNMSSVSSTMGFTGQSVYGGTKAALEAMTRSWARELAERCTVNAVNPGPVATDMWSGTTSEFKAGVSPFIKTAPLAAVRPGVDSEEMVEGAKIAGGRPGYVEEIAGSVAMLCTKDAGWCTGQVVCANGGMRFAM